MAKMTLSELLIKVLSDKEYKKQFASTLVSSDINSEFPKLEFSNTVVHEDLFLELISGFKKDKELLEIFDNINHYILNETNVTDDVFKELVKFGEKQKRKRVFLALCHATLKPEHMKYLRTLKFLNESFFY